MNPNSNQTPRQELEAKITALVLGELAPEEAALLRLIIEQDADLTKLHDRLAQTIGLVHEAAVSQPEQSIAQSAPLKLSEERRQKLLAQFKTVAPAEFVDRPRQRSWIVPLAGAAVLMLLAAIAIPNFTQARVSSQSNSILNNLRILEGAKEQWALENHKTATDVPTAGDLQPYLKGGQMPQAVAGETYVVGKVSDPIAAEVDGARARKWFGGTAIRQSIREALGGRVRLLADAELTFAGKNAGARPPDDRLKREFEPSNQALAFNSPRQTASRTEIVLPPNTETADTDRMLLQPQSSQVKSDAFRTGLESIEDEAVRRSALTGGTGGGGGGAGGGNFGAEGISGSRIAVTDSEPGGQMISLLEKPAQRESNSFLGRYAYVAPTSGTPPAEAGVKAAVSPDGRVEAKFADLSDKDAKALNFDWNRSSAGIGLWQSGTAPTLAGPPPKLAKEIHDSTADARLAARLAASFGTFSGRLEEQAKQRGFPSQVAAVPKALPRNLPAPGKEPEATGLRSTERGQVLDRQSDVVPALGEVPSVGTLFQTNNSPAGELLAYNRLMMERYGLIRDGTLPTGKDEKPAAVPNSSGFAEQDVAGKTIKSVSNQGAVSDRKTSGDAGIVELEQLNGDITKAEGKLGAMRGKLKLSDAAADASGVATSTLEPETKRRLEAEISKLDPGTSERRALETAVETATKQDAQMAANNRHDFEAKRELENLKKLRDAVQLRAVQGTVDAAAPKAGEVEIVDLAEARTGESPTLKERISRALSGKVERSARVTIGRDVSDVNRLGFEKDSAKYDPYFIQTESEKIRSKSVLNKVIEKLNLNEAWATRYGGGAKLTTEETYKLLTKNVGVQQEPNTSLIDIRVKSDKPEEAAQIANTIAEVYRDSRVEQRKAMNIQAVEALNEKLANEEKLIASAREQLDRLKPENQGQQANEDRPVRRLAPNAPIPQPEIQTRDNAFSTFSLNVSDVSFKLAAASLEKGQMPEPASVRSEEFINAFDYRDPEPPASVPIGFAWERARYPFAHNRDLLRFSIKTAAAGRQSGRPLNLVLLLDNSGSMERADRVRIIHEALRMLAAQLQPQDKFSVITFARTARLWVDGVPGSQAAEVVGQVSGLTPQGGTNLEDAMGLAYATALRHYLANGINRVVLLTDGAANLGNVEPELLKQKVETFRKQGIALDCFGIGWEGYDDDVLEVLSRNGDGRYGFINSPEEAATGFAGQLAGALKVAASDVKVQVEFNPRRVTAYRQIGYARHQLTKEQFRDNTVDAAEIGAAEAGNALYTVDVNPRGEGPLCTVRVRFKIPGAFSYQEHAWDVPFVGNSVSLEQASPAMRLAAVASSFSEWLVSSPFAGEVTPDGLLRYLNGVPEVYGADPRPKKLEWMLRQAKSLAGK